MKNQIHDLIWSHDDVWQWPWIPLDPMVIFGIGSWIPSDPWWNWWYQIYDLGKSMIQAGPSCIVIRLSLRYADWYYYMYQSVPHRTLRENGLITCQGLYPECWSIKLAASEVSTDKLLTFWKKNWLAFACNTADMYSAGPLMGLRIPTHKKLKAIWYLFICT